jgi:hypothetical protein
MLLTLLKNKIERELKSSLLSYMQVAKSLNIKIYVTIDSNKLTVRLIDNKIIDEINTVITDNDNVKFNSNVDLSNYLSSDKNGKIDKSILNLFKSAQKQRKRGKRQTKD